MRGRGRLSNSLKSFGRSLKKTTKILKHPLSEINKLFGTIKNKFLIARVIAHMNYLKNNNETKFNEIMALCDKINNKMGTKTDKSITDISKLAKKIHKVNTRTLIDQIDHKTETEIRSNIEQKLKVPNTLEVDKIMDAEIENAEKLVDTITDRNGNVVLPEDMEYGVNYDLSKKINGKVEEFRTMLVGGKLEDNIIYKIIAFIVVIIFAILFSPVL